MLRCPAERAEAGGGAGGSGACRRTRRRAHGVARRLCHEFKQVGGAGDVVQAEVLRGTAWQTPASTGRVVAKWQQTSDKWSDCPVTCSVNQ